MDDPKNLNSFWEIIANKGHVYLCGKPQLEPFVRKAVTNAAKKFGRSFVSSAFLDSTDSIESLLTRYPYLLHISTYNGGHRSNLEKLLLPSEVAQHRSMSSCFVSFRGFVYDLTEFLMLHPGGAKILFDKTGRDITNDFNLAHGKDPNPFLAMIEPYRIGLLFQFPDS